MASGQQFEYLPLVLREHGPARFPQAVQGENPTTAANKADRSGHAGGLRSPTTSVSTNWKSKLADRARDGLPVADVGIPLLLKIDPSLELDDLRRQFSFEIIAEHEDGFVIVTSEDVDLGAFQQKLTDFVGTVSGSSNIAKIHELREDFSQEERLSRILTSELLSEWPTIADDSTYVVEVGVTCVGDWEVPKKPKQNPRWKEKTWAKKENEWSNARIEAYDRWDDLKEERLDGIRQIIGHYGADILMNVDGGDAEALRLPDSFTLRIQISGMGLRDLALSYPYIFEITEPEDIETPQSVERELKATASQLEITAPDDGAPSVCVIDSGIQEEHPWLEPGMDKATSRCFLSGTPDSEIADRVQPSGHGTRVAGAVLHGETVPKSGVIQLDTWVQNARVLNDDCGMPTEMFPPAVLRLVVETFHNGPRSTRIFNHSINSDVPCRTRHMSAWAAEIDQLCTENDILVIQSSGNLKPSRPAPKLGVADQIAAGRPYPEYLSENASRVASPGHSLQALTVGSVAYGTIESDGWRSFASEIGQPSAFSRAGLGIWESIKPEVVEYGGDYLVTQSDPPDVDSPVAGRDVYPELVRSTIHGGPAFDRDEVGTSYAAPKVARIAARLQAILPDEPCLLYRALIVQSARWPEWAANLPREDQEKVLRRIGFGIPDLDRATTNTDHRTTFITHKERSLGPGDCHIYQVPIPDGLRRPGDDYDVRIDVTLSYAASPRRTRRTPRGYLATWLDWISNRKGESIEAFLTRAMKSDDAPVKEGAGALGWTIESRGNWGRLQNVRRNVGTVQKDWAVVKSNALPDDFCIAVRGHQGWCRDSESVANYTLAVTFDLIGEEIPIYEPLRTAVLDLESQVESEVEAELELQT